MPRVGWARPRGSAELAGAARWSFSSVAGGCPARASPGGRARWNPAIGGCGRMSGLCLGRLGPALGAMLIWRGLLADLRSASRWAAPLVLAQGAEPPGTPRLVVAVGCPAYA